MSQDIPRKGTAGSRAAGGWDYQSRVTAWFGARILAGDRASGVPGLYQGPVLNLVCETGDEVDDCRVGLPDDVLLLQAKHSVQLEKAETSPMGQTVAQFVRQHLTAEQARDKLVLVTTSVSPATVTKDLKGALDGFRDGYPERGSLLSGANEMEKHALAVFLGHVKREWARSSESAAEPTDEELRAFLKRCWVWTLNVDEGGPDEVSTLDLLRSSVLSNPSLADSAWDSLQKICETRVKTRTGFDRVLLEAKLAERLPGGLEAFTDLQYRRIRPDGPASPLTFIPVPEGEDAACWIARPDPGNPMWVREGPGRTYKVISQFADGERVYGSRAGVAGEGFTWHLVRRRDGGWAWANGQYLRPVEDQATLAEWTRRIVDNPEMPTLRARLKVMPPLDEEGLRATQAEAIRNIETSLAGDLPTLYLDPGSFGSLIVSTAALAWTIYNDLRNRHPSAPPDADALARQVRMILRQQEITMPEGYERMIEIVSTEITRHNSLPQPPATMPVTIYLAEEASHEQVESAVVELLGHAALEVVHRDDPVIGSWFRRLWAGARPAVTSPAAREAALTATHVVDTHLILAQDAQVTAILLQNLGTVIASLQYVNDAVVRVGALLIVKINGKVQVLQLTAAQQAILDHRPHLASAPGEIIAALQPLSPEGNGHRTAIE